MHIPPWIENLYLRTADYFYSAWPQPLPEIEKLERCRIVSHRGEYDNVRIFENTIAAFDEVEKNGVWGIELDIRWTKDLHPIVHHDMDLQRIFGLNEEIRNLTLNELKDRFPLVPSLEEIISRYGDKLHLMVEIKEEVYPEPPRQNEILKGLFKGLEPGEDFHLISLTPGMFKLFDFVPLSAFLPVALVNLQRMSELALKENYGGVNGHYLFITKKRMEKHRRAGQKVGAGYIGSKNSLCRELNRGIEWIFSNNGVELQGIRNSLIDERKR